MLRTYCVLFLACLSLALPAWATNYHVAPPPLGNDSRSCATAQSSSTPRATIGAGRNCLGPGDTLLLMNGSYEESLIDGGFPGGTSWSAPVTIKGFPGHTVIWQADSGCTNQTIDCRFAIWVRNPSERYISFEDFTVEGNGQTTNGIIVDSGTDTVANQPHHIRFVNVNVRNNYSNYFNFFRSHDIEVLGGSFRDNCCLFFNPGPLTPVGYYMFGVSNVVIDGVDIGSTNGYAIQVYAGGDPTKQSSNVTIRNSKIHHSGNINGENSGIRLTDLDTAQIINNVIYRNGFAANNQGGGIWSTASNVAIYHNTITQNYGQNLNGAAALYIDGGSATIRNNILWDNNGTEYLVAAGSVTASNNPTTTNPLFTNIGTDDYHLTGTSPMINAGTTMAGVTTDKDGNTRMGLPDIGAYEFVTGSSPTVGTFFVAPGGSDSNSCDDAKGTIASPSTLPLATMNKAFTCAAGTSTIVLRNGTYTESLDTGSQPIAPGSSFLAATVIRSFPGEIATIQRTTSGIHFHFNSTSDHDIIFDGTSAPAGQYGIVIDGIATTDLNLVVIRSAAQRLRFQGVRFRRGFYESLFIQGATGVEIIASKIDENVFLPLIAMSGTTGTVIRQNEITGADDGPGIGPLSSGNTSPIIERNSIHDNAGAGIDISGDTNAKIINNLIYSNTAGAGVVVKTGSSGALLYNNTFWSNSGAPLQIDSGASTTTYRNNIFSSNGNSNNVANSGTGTVQDHNFSGDPSFVSPGPPSNFHVESLSVIGQGATLAEVTVDYFGVGRSTPYTIGATQENTPTPPALAVRGLPFATTPFLAVP